MGKLNLRYRQVHLDFHTSPYIQNIGDSFNAEEFANTLKKARVNSITCFARCHHGMLYYDSKLFPEMIHPNLKNRNLLQEQIEVCHRYGIRVPIYTTVMWDDYNAKEHPEWLTKDENGKVINWYGEYEAGFYRFLCINSPYRDFLKAHVKEILETISPCDGLFFDILYPVDCSCKHCVEKMEMEGYNPLDKKERLQFAEETINNFIMEMSSLIREYDKDCSTFYNSSHIGPNLRSRLKGYSHLEIESLPSGGWGYLHFPITVRYSRSLGVDCLGLTAKFHTEWGDFHSFKNKEALEYECFHMLALNAKCMIGDQMEPCGELSKHVYELIGSVYEQIERKEPWCENGKAIADIGVFTPEEFYSPEEEGLPPAIMGAAQMLMEAGHQFDIIDSKMDFSKYKVLIMPDKICLSKEFADKLEKYINDGGAVIASFESGMEEDGDGFKLSQFGVQVKNTLTCDIHGVPVKGKVFDRAAYADYILPRGDIGKGIPETEHVMYIKGLEVDALRESEVLANVILPFFPRTYKHFSSHRQAPSSGKVGYAGIVKNGNVIYFAHPVFTQYRQNAPKWCKQLVLNALDMLLPEPVLKHDGPSTMICTINEQQKEKRAIVHLLHYIPQRRCEEIDIIEDVIPLYEVKVSVKVSENIQNVMLVPEQANLKYELKDGRVDFTVPKVNGHQMIAIEFEK